MAGTANKALPLPKAAAPGMTWAIVRLQRYGWRDRWALALCVRSLRRKPAMQHWHRHVPCAWDGGAHHEPAFVVAITGASGFIGQALVK